MRFHVLGLGPIGSLVAFHLRRVLSRKHDIHLIFRTQALAKANIHPDRSREIHVEHHGVVSTTNGFKTEAMVHNSSKVYDMVFNKGGTLRLPTRDWHSGAEAERLETGEGRKESEEIEALLVTCKAPSTLSALKRLQHRLTPKSTIVLLQNGGLATYEQLILSLFRNPATRPHFILVSNNHGAWQKSPTHIVHAGIGTIHFGIVPDGRRDFEKSMYDTSVPQEQRTLKLDDILQPQDDPLHSQYRSLRNTVAVLGSLTELQPTWEPISNLQIFMRRKLVVNCVINPLTALLGCRNGELYANEDAQRLARRICSEAAAVFAAEARASAGSEVDPSQVYVPRVLRANPLMEEWQRAARLTAGNMSSMLSDIRKGNAETEIDYLNGYLVGIARRHGVRLPVNASIVDLVKLRTSIPIDSPL